MHTHTYIYIYANTIYYLLLASIPCPYSDDRRCNSSQACIRADQWCNQQVDCMDGSDEENCCK